MRIMTTSGTVRGILFLILAGLVFSALPAAADAATNVPAVVTTKQVLPLGGNACPQLNVVAVQTYVYDGALHSFEVVLPNASYVALQGTVGDAIVPFHQMTRRVNTAGQLHTLVTVPTTPLSRAQPITLTLISAVGGQPVCLSIVSFTAASTGASAPITITKPVSPVAPAKPAPATTSKPTAQGTTSAGTTSVISSVITGSGLGSTILRACTSQGAALQLWFVLLTIFLILCAAVAITEPPLAERNVYLPGALIGVPLVLLGAFWLFAAECRGAGWVPFAALIVAAGGALWSYRKRPVIANVIQLPPAKKSN